ncbi:MAG: alpha/beta hydrolase [Paracoccaceae bacterium]
MSTDPDTLLSGPRVGPQAGGAATALVVLLHGYGADGRDLAGLAGPLGEALPRAAFRAPNAPERCRINPMGYQWFPIPWIDGAPEAEMEASFRASVERLDGWLDAAMAAEGVDAAATALVGFSQGTMMSLYVAPRRAEAVAGIVGFSGRLVAGEDLAQAARVRPPVLLVHGDRDEVIPVAALSEAERGLSGAGFAVEAHVSPGTPHGIAPDGLGHAARFLSRVLPGAAR